MKKRRSEATLKGVGIAVLATIFARGFGFVRELLIASVFGTSSLGDAFIVSLSIPDILVSGFSFAIATIYIPTFFLVKKETNDLVELEKYNTSVFSLMLLLGIVITTLVELIPEYVVMLFATGLDQQTINLTASLLRIISLSIMPIFLGSLFKAYGQIVNKFSNMTIYGCVINLTIIAALIIKGKQDIKLLAWSVVIGNVFYALITYISARRDDYCIQRRIILKNKYLLGMITGIIPVFISDIIAEINQIIDKNFASRLSVGTISVMNYATKIINLITSILGATIANVFYKKFSLLFAQGDRESLANEIKKINWILLAILLPIFYTIIFFSNTIVSILFGRGAFDEHSVNTTSIVLCYYALGIIGFNLKSVWIRIYNAELDTKTPAINSIITVIANVIMNLCFINVLQERGLALATALASVFSDLLLIRKYTSKNKYFDSKELYMGMIKIVTVSLVYIPCYYLCSRIKYTSILVELFMLVMFFIIVTVIYLVILMAVSKLLRENILNYIKKGRSV